LQGNYIRQVYIAVCSLENSSRRQGTGNGRKSENAYGFIHQFPHFRKQRLRQEMKSKMLTARKKLVLRERARRAINEKNVLVKKKATGEKLSKTDKLALREKARREMCPADGSIPDDVGVEVHKIHKKTMPAPSLASPILIALAFYLALQCVNSNFSLIHTLQSTQHILNQGLGLLIELCERYDVSHGSTTSIPLIG
jgi:hypothetical protein